jgi:hypothetical protein
MDKKRVEVWRTIANTSTTPEYVHVTKIHENVK